MQERERLHTAGDSALREFWWREIGPPQNWKIDNTELEKTKRRDRGLALYLLCRVVSAGGLGTSKSTVISFSHLDWNRNQPAAVL